MSVFSSSFILFDVSKRLGCFRIEKHSPCTLCIDCTGHFVMAFKMYSEETYRSSLVCVWLPLSLLIRATFPLFYLPRQALEPVMPGRAAQGSHLDGTRTWRECAREAGVHVRRSCTAEEWPPRTVSLSPSLCDHSEVLKGRCVVSPASGGTAVAETDQSIRKYVLISV